MERSEQTGQRRQGKSEQKHEPIKGTAQQGIRAVRVKLYPSAPLVRQAKPGRSSGLGGVHHVNSLFDM